MNKHIAGFCHIALWAFLFLSPLTFWRGTGFSLQHYLMTCIQPAFLMLVFYLNYLVLAPRLFVSGKHRYDLLINIVLITTLGILQHYWMELTHSIYTPNYQEPDAIGTVSYIVRDSINLGIFAGGATALALARRWVTANQKLQEAEAARSQAELSNLRSQINPHFLLNTLNNIYALTAFDTTKAQEAIERLSKMLRHILYDYQQPGVTLKDEADFLQNYVHLMRIRLPESVDVQFHTSILHPQQEITPMLFISLVENAFKHGVSPSGPSFIHISIKSNDREIICDIQNTNHPKTANDRSGHGIGLLQVQRRLDLSYAGHYQWHHGPIGDGSVYQSRIVIQLENSNQSKNI